MKGLEAEKWTLTLRIQLLRELARIQHPNIVSLEDIFLSPQDKSLYMVFEYAEYNLFVRAILPSPPLSSRLFARAMMPKPHASERRFRRTSYDTIRITSRAWSCTR